VPKHALKRLGLKIVFDEAGNPSVVEKEGATKGDFDPARAFATSSHNARVAAFVKDLLAEDEDEAELPARAARRPVVHAAAVQSEHQL
jgi:elongation factor Ts